MVSRLLQGAEDVVQPLQQLGIVQKGFDLFGLRTPFQRFTFGFAVCETAIFVLKPRFAFTSTNELKHLAIFGPGGKNTTWVPWYLPGLALGGVLAVFF
jgi:hypothetical protein